LRLFFQRILVVTALVIAAKTQLKRVVIENVSEILHKCYGCLQVDVWIKEQRPVLLSRRASEVVDRSPDVAPPSLPSADPRQYVRGAEDGVEVRPRWWVRPSRTVFRRILAGDRLPSQRTYGGVNASEGPLRSTEHFEFRPFVPLRDTEETWQYLLKIRRPSNQLSTYVGGMASGYRLC
jgi:hypothetical protein